MDANGLLHEAERLRLLLAKHMQSHIGLNKQSVTVFSCLAHGVDLKNAQHIVECLSDTGTSEAEWFTLELEAARFPRLTSEVQSFPLGQTLCPETGLLLPSVFRKNMISEWEKVRKTGGMLAMILFEPTDAPARLDIGAQKIISKRGTLSLSQVFAEQADSEASMGVEAENAAVSDYKVLRSQADCLAYPSDQVKVFSAEELLVLLAQTVRAYARGCDIPAHLDGQRIALLLPETSVLRARSFAERLILAFGESLRRHCNGLHVRQSLRAGIAGADPEGHNPEELLHRVAEALETAPPGGTRTFRKGSVEAIEQRTQVQASEKHFLFFGTEKTS